VRGKIAHLCHLGCLDRRARLFRRSPRPLLGRTHAGKARDQRGVAGVEPEARPEGVACRSEAPEALLRRP